MMVRVKPLRWKRGDGETESRDSWHAHSIVGRYFVIEGQWWCRQTGADGSAVSNRAAKAEAQADYSARILSALEEQPREVSVAEAARVLLAAGSLPTDAVRAAHHQIDWCRNAQNTYDPYQPDEDLVGTNCAEDVQGAWAAALRALAGEDGQ